MTVSNTPDYKYFDFEADFVASLRCIPMQVRYKLDTCGVKLKLQHWHQFSTEERQHLVALPCETMGEITQYRDYLQGLVTQHTGSPAKDLEIDSVPPWMETSQIPADLQAKLVEVGCNVSLQQWQAIDPLKRFTLIKLSRPGHENHNFVPALQEFGLV
jgi:hypothetical protein